MIVKSKFTVEQQWWWTMQWNVLYIGAIQVAAIWQLIMIEGQIMWCRIKGPVNKGNSYIIPTELPSTLQSESTSTFIALALAIKILLNWDCSVRITGAHWSIATWITSNSLHASHSIFLFHNLETKGLPWTYYSSSIFGVSAHPLLLGGVQYAPSNIMQLLIIALYLQSNQSHYLKYLLWLRYIMEWLRIFNGACDYL